ncbi:MAG: hypothetical protein J7I99_05415, partial [Methanophagales archaeon]|nr:hypothetical protein [Methanophagales archaeon]
GISPASITISDAFKGGTYERTITVFNTGDETGTFELTAEGECADWISFYKPDEPNTPITEVTVPGKGKASVLVKFDIPADIANANYTATIYARSIPEGGGGEGAVAHAVIRIPSKVVIQVTGTQILKGSVKSITAADTEVGYPLKIKVVFQNEGNVIARPKIAVTITKTGEGVVVDRFVHEETGIKPGKEGIIKVLWNTTGRDTGDYIANITVSLGDEVLATKDLHFKILPLGSLTRSGVLHSLAIEGEPLVNIVIKLVANFVNTGEIDTMAKFRGEIYHEGNLLDVLGSEEMFVESGETAKLVSYYKILEPGNYTIKGRVLYAGKETEEKEVSFSVPVPEVEELGEDKNGIPGFEAGFAIIALSFISIFLAFGHKRRKRRCKRE